MKAPEWKQKVLFVSQDTEAQSIIASAFGNETEFVRIASSEDAIKALDRERAHILILDTQLTDPKLHYSEESDQASFLELSQYANQLYPEIIVIVIAGKLKAKEGSFARKSGISLIMNRSRISTDLMVYVIRILRKRTFRTVLLHDLKKDGEYSENLYHYLPANDRYAIFLPAGIPLSEAKIQKLNEYKIRHLYIRSEVLNDFFKSLKSRSPQHSKSISEELSDIRTSYKNALVQFFDTSSDGSIHFGKILLSDLQQVAFRISQLITRYPDKRQCLLELPYPRWSALAHSLNCAIYTYLFADIVPLPFADDTAIAALIHNVGLAEINQKIVNQKETDLSPAEKGIYQKHPARSVEMAREKFVPLNSIAEKAILYHHENHDGTGFPDQIFGENIPREASFLSLIGAFDYFNTTRPGDQAKTTRQAWEELKQYHVSSTDLHARFNPAMLKNLDALFQTL